MGHYSMASNTTGSGNVAIGHNALDSITTASDNISIGRNAICANTTGYSNVSIGSYSSDANTTGFENTVIGVSALGANTTGSCNTAVGRNAFRNRTTAEQGVAVGMNAGCSNTTGNGNTFVGVGAGVNSTTGYQNHVFGVSAGSDAVKNITTENHQIVIGNNGSTHAYIKIAWTVTSDERDKMEFKSVPHGLDFVNKLEPVAFKFRKDRNSEIPTGDVRYGFKAQDILALEGDNPVIIDNHDSENLKYKGEALVPVLVNAIKELNNKIEELEAKLNG
jgi:hypothetical protein